MASEGGNLALKLRATGGVYMAGGIVLYLTKDAKGQTFPGACFSSRGEMVIEGMKRRSAWQRTLYRR